MSVQWRLLSHQCNLGHAKIGSVQKTTCIASLNLSSSLTSSTTKSIGSEKPSASPTKEVMNVWRYWKGVRSPGARETPIAQVFQASLKICEFVYWPAPAVLVSKPLKSPETNKALHHCIIATLHFKTLNATNANFSISPMTVTSSNEYTATSQAWPSLWVEWVDLICFPKMPLTPQNCNKFSEAFEGPLTFAAFTCLVCSWFQTAAHDSSSGHLQS